MISLPMYHNLKFPFFSVLAAAFTGTVSVLAEPTARAEPVLEPWPFEISDLEADPSVTWGELDNGVRYAIMPNDEPRERVSLRLFIRAGSLEEKDSQRGVAHFLEHMAFNGTENFGPGTLVEYFQRLGMAFGADTNAYTSFDRTVYMIELPDPEPSKIDEGLLVLRDYAGRMLLTEEQIEAERNVVLSEMRTRDSVGYRTAVAEFDFLLPQSRIPDRFPIGAAEVLRSATRTDFVDYYNTWYRPENTVLVVVGEVEPEEVEDLIEKNFGGFAPRAPDREEPDLGEVVSDDVRALLHTEMEAPSTRVSIQTVAPYDPQPDTRELRVAQLHRDAAFQILTRRLDTLSRQENAPFSRGSAAGFEMFDFVSNSSIELTCEPENWEESLRLAEQELRRALKYGFQEAELREVKAIILNAYEEAVRRAETRQSSNLAEGIIATLAHDQVFTTPQAELEMMRPAVEAMTTDDLVRALRESWAPEGRFLFVSGNLQLAEADEKILDVFRSSQAEEVEPMEELTEAKFAYTDLGSAGEVAEHKHIEDLDVHQVRFENGVRLNVKTTEFQANRVQALIRFGGGQLTEPLEKQGVALLASAAFTAGGLGEHSVDELRRILAGRNVGVHFSVGEDAFQLSGSTTPDDLLLQLQLMAAYLMDPGYRPEALRLSQNELREVYRSSRHTAQGTLQAEGSRFLASGDHRFGLPPLENLLALELADVQAWLAEALASGYLELTLVGDVSVDQAVEAVKGTLGALPERDLKKPDYGALRVVRFPEEKEEEFSFESDLPKGISAVYWPTDDIWDIRQTRRLQVLAQAFSDRMRIRIREGMGDAYSPYAVSQPSDTYVDYGLFLGLVGIDPERAREVADVVLEIAADIHGNGLTDDELERALKPVVTSLRTVVRDNSYWLNSVLASSQEYPQRLEWARHMMSDYASITTEEVNDLAREYLAPEKALRVFVLPTEDEKVAK